MNLFLQIREALGLTQEALAQLLGVQVGLLKMAETNRRTLPPQAMQRLVWFLNFVRNLSPTQESIQFSPEAVSALLLQIKKKKRETDALVQKQDTKRKQMQSRLVFASAFSAQFPAENHQSETARLNALTLEARSHLQYETEAELEIRVRQAGLTAMVKFLEGLLAG